MHVFLEAFVFSLLQASGDKVGGPSTLKKIALRSFISTTVDLMYVAFSYVIYSEYSIKSFALFFIQP